VRISFTDRFRRCCRDLDATELSGVMDALLGLDRVIGASHSHSGLGIRKVHASGIWEMRAGLELRALFRLRGDTAEFAFLGTHDEVKRFLKGL
jgi:hypothetical protein